MIEFEGWPKTPRLFRDVTVTEKIDGTNAAVIIVPGHPSDSDTNCTITKVGDEYLKVGAQSRKRIITPDADNFGFAAWVFHNAEMLAQVLGAGRHFGEWWGSGIQRGYGLTNGEKRFSVFNTHRHSGIFGRSSGLVDHVPVLYQGPFSTYAVNGLLDRLEAHGSVAEPGFMRPEGVVVYHSASNQVFKALIENDDQPKGAVA